ncbi:CHASE domain-containing protein [Geothrix sp. 21YS21S-2]|uniref:CHASE domain-containing protein n=1 Tax=Geothrix sp. 21YS21S-2 TaxID=3068893 RepID=UPI0027B8ED01|nr:CHASE domain-containing protein [Geothrix sp. 21YS21S-2]
MRAFRGFWPLAGLLCGVLLTLVAWSMSRQVERTRIRDLQRDQARSLAMQLEFRMKSLEEVLRGSAGYLGRGSLPSRGEFRDYVEGLELPTLHPGAQGLGFAEWIAPGDLEAHTRRMRREGFPDYRVEPGGALAPGQDGCSAIIYLEPMDARNRRAFGKDMSADQVQRAAMLRARDQGVPLMSGPVTLYQETATDVQVGTLFYAPVYDRRLPRDTVAQRRVAFRGWTYLPFRMGDLVRGTLAQERVSADVALVDGPAQGGGPLLFESVPDFARGGPALERSFPVGGRVWTLQVRSNASFFAGAGSRGHWEILVAGLALSLGFATVLFLGQGAAHRAHRMALSMAEELRMTGARFGTLFEKAPVGMAIVNSVTGGFVAVNPRLGQILGYTPGELLERTFQDLTHSDHVAADLASLGDVISGKVEEFAKEKRYLHSDGHVVWGRLRVVRLPLDLGGVPHHLALVEDITGHMRALENLRESEARFRNLVENAVDPIFLFDPEGRILLANLEASRLTGYSREELANLRVQDLSPDMPMDAYAGIWNALAFGESRRFEGRTRRKDGTSFPVEVRIGLLAPGEPRQILSMVRDLSAVDQAAQSELRARKAESLVLMAGGIAHDFNNVFQAIQSNLEIAGFMTKGNVDLALILDQARAALGRAVTLSRKMLDFSGRGIVRLEPMELEDLLDRVPLKPGLMLERDFHAVPPILGDPGKLEQVVTAMLDNALEAGASRVRLRLRTHAGAGAGTHQGVWPLPQFHAPGTVCLEVQDDGPGVAPDKLHLICDPFYTTREPGRGLGLAAAVGILKAHRAGFHVQNGEGEGLVLRMYFRTA